MVRKASPVAIAMTTANREGSTALNLRRIQGSASGSG
jgi:hypothetical protein